MNGFRCLTYKERLKALTIPYRAKRRLRNDLVVYNEIDLEATPIFRFPRRPDLTGRSIKLGELEEEGTVLHSGSTSAGIFSHVQSNRYHT